MKKIKDSNDSNIPIEFIQSEIFFINGKKVMLDRDLAELYRVETQRLKEQDRMNKKRFPKDFIFKLIFFVFSQEDFYFTFTFIIK